MARGEARTESNDRFETSETRSTEAALPDAWAGTSRDPRPVATNVGACRTGQGTMLYDRESPGTYLVGRAVDLGEMT